MGFGLSFSKSKSSSSSKSESTSKTGLPQDVINQIKGEAGGIYQKLKDQGYTEKEIVGMNEDQLAGLQRLSESGHLDDVIKQTQGGIDNLWGAVDSLNEIGAGGRDQTTEQLKTGALDLVNSDILKQQTGAIDQGATSAVNQANQLIQRNLQENTLPSIYRDGVSTGGTGSSRSAIAQGVAARGAMEQSSNTAQNILNAANQQKADLTNQMYSQGLQYQNQQAQSNIANQLAGIMGGIQGSNTAIGALGQKAGAGQQSILNQLQSGQMQQQQGQAEADNAYFNEMQKKLKDAGVTDISTIMDILNQMNPLMDKTTTGKQSGTQSGTNVGATSSFK